MMVFVAVGIAGIVLGFAMVIWAFEQQDSSRYSTMAEIDFGAFVAGAGAVVACLGGIVASIPLWP